MFLILYSSMHSSINPPASNFPFLKEHSSAPDHDSSESDSSAVILRYKLSLLL